MYKLLSLFYLCNNKLNDMISAELANIDKLVIHKIGNRKNDEGVSFSKTAIQTDEMVDKLLLKYFFSPFVTLKIGFVLYRGEIRYLGHVSIVHRQFLTLNCGLNTATSMLLLAL